MYVCVCVCVHIYHVLYMNISWPQVYICIFSNC